jgi:glutathione synthase/RimK-type ligase-like ATP-grasp enzyme
MPLVYFISGLLYGAPDNETIYLIKALKEREIQSSRESWDDPNADWSKPDLCIHRNSPYFLEPKKFLEWTKNLEKNTTVWNSLKVTEWNHNKRYLIDLEEAGIPIPSTVMIEQDAEEPLQYYLEGKDWKEIILKPTITAGSLGLQRFKSGSPESEEHFQVINKKGITQTIPGAGEYYLPPSETLVQEYLPEIITAGEVSLIYFGGKYSHSVIKKVKSGDFRAHPLWGAAVEPYKASVEERAVADSALEVAGDFIHFARIDLLNLKGGPVIIEVELIEPWLFFDYFPDTVNTYADHIANFFK